MLTPLAHRPYALLWTGQSVSRAGNYIFDTVITVAVYQLTHSGVHVGAVLGVLVATSLLFLPFAGAAGDRGSRVRIVLAADIISGTVSLALGVGLLTDHLPLPAVYGAAALVGALSAYHQPSYKALIKATVPDNAHDAAVALTTLTNNMIRLGGPALAGLVLLLGNAAAGLLIDAATFAVAATTLTAARIPTPPVPPTRGNGLLHDIREGAITVARTPWLRRSFLTSAAVSGLALAPLDALMPLIVLTGGMSPATIGWLGAAQGAGAVTGSILFLPHRRPHSPAARLRLYYTLLALGAAATLTVALTAHLPNPARSMAMTAAMTTTGIAMAGYTLHAMLLQTHVPERLLSRVVAADILASGAPRPLALPLAGALAGPIGPTLLLAVCGLTATVTTTTIALTPGQPPDTITPPPDPTRQPAIASQTG
ncbi:hypothetical protein FrCorBMG51_17085 [Protofrankia coriariae]|uniref:MFS transporter n=2 Tax=Protofrankia coriariae TaxID=1562887 RepID=A0ABR5F1M6_9ACTN|nr:hypothetical protein FrCorBMG51_17085 [Protofrankia coriariae]